jgi:hypothetical protein
MMEFEIRKGQVWEYVDDLGPERWIVRGWIDSGNVIDVIYSSGGKRGTIRLHAWTNLVQSGDLRLIRQ